MIEREFVAHYTRENRRLLRFIRRNCARDVEDIASETWLHAWRSKDSYNGQSAYFTYLRVIALNVIRDMFRKERGHIRTEELTPFILTTGACGPHPEKAIVAADTVRDMVRGLRGSETGIFTMRFVHGLAWRQISSRTGVDPNTLKSRTRRMLGRIR